MQKIYNHARLAQKALSILLAVLMVIPTMLYSISVGMEDVKAASAVAEGEKIIDCFPDEYFAKYVYVEVMGKEADTWAANKDTYTLDTNDVSAIKSTTTISWFLYSEKKSIKSVIGIDNFIALTELNLNGSGIEEIDVSQNTKLTELVLSGTNIEEIDVSQNTELTELNLSNTNISEIDVSQNTKLTELYLDSTNISEIDVSQNTKLASLGLDSTNISEIDVSQNTVLGMLRVNNTNITEINVSGNEALETLWANGTGISEIDVSQNTALDVLQVGDTDISEIDISQNTNLYYLYIPNTNITELDLPNINRTLNLDVSGSKLKSLDLSHVLGMSNTTDLSGQVPDFEYEKIGTNQYRIIDIPLDGRVSNLKINDVAYDGSLTSDIIVENLPTKVSYDYDTQANGSYGKTLSVTSESVTEVPLSKIEITTEPDKTAYAVGEKFDPAGLVLTLTYGNSDTAEVTYNEDTKNDFSFSPDTGLKITNDKVTITYLNHQDKSVDQGITVKQYVENIYLTNPDKTISLLGTLLEGSSLKVNNLASSESSYNTLLKDMGDNKEILVSVDVSLVNGTYEPGTEMTLTFSVDPKYNGKTATIKHLLKDGTIKTYNAVVSNGAVQITVTELSPFMVAVEKDVIQNPDEENPGGENQGGQNQGDQNQGGGSGDNNYTQDQDNGNDYDEDGVFYGSSYQTGDNAPIVELILVVAAAALILVACVVYRRKNAEQ